MYGSYRPKFHNEEVTSAEGFHFDSKKELSRWKELKALEMAGYITHLERQRRFELIPKQLNEKGKVVERACEYIADFCYDQNNEFVVEDVKSAITRKQPEYVIKRKLMLWIHKIRIKEV